MIRKELKMKKESGITLASLVIYVIIFSFTLGLLAALSGFIFGNIDNINSDSISSEEFNKFHINFLKDIKEYNDANIYTGNDIVTITFGSNNETIYTYKSSDKAIYKNKVKIATNILKFEASKKEDTEHNNKKVITVTIATGKNAEKPNFTKTINYVLKYW